MGVGIRAEHLKCGLKLRLTEWKGNEFIRWNEDTGEWLDETGEEAAADVVLDLFSNMEQLEILA